MSGGVRELPASSVQRQFWLLQSLSPHSVAYHVPALFRIRGTLDTQALERALGQVVHEHNALRTTFVEREGVLMQRVHEYLAPSFVIDEQAAEIGSPSFQQEFQRPFNLAEGPLIRMRLWPAAVGGWWLSWTMHHAICDLETKNLVSAAISRHYASYVGSSASGIAPTPSDYADFALWEQSFLASDVAKRAEDYFAQHLGPAAQLTPLAVPEDYARPKLHSQRGACVHFVLPESLVDKLRERSTQLTTKPFLLLLAAYGVLLGRYGQHERVVLGVPFTNRKQQSQQGVVGAFVNNLPLAIELRPDATFASVCRDVRATMLGHHRHQELPLERVVSRLRPVRDTARNPLFQAGFTFEPPPSLPLAGAQVEGLDVHAGGSQLDLFMTLWPHHEGGFAGRLEYCTQLFEHASMQRLVRCYMALLEHALSADAIEHVSLAQLDILAPRDRYQVVSEFNDTQRSYPGPWLMHEAFCAQVARTPDATALRMGARGASYRELGERANGLAHELRAAGVGPGERVGIFMERSFEMVTAIYATLIAGASYVPLDPDFPEVRLGHMLQDVTPRIVLTHAATHARLPPTNVTCRSIAFDALQRTAAAPVLAQALDTRAPAYVIFTSGSTGRPKGASNSHEGICNRIQWMHDAYQLQAHDVVLQKTPFSFDVSTWEFFWPLTVGATLQIADPGVHRDPSALAELITRTGVTTLHFVPSMLDAFIAHPAAASCSSLRRIVCSGEALSAALVVRTAALLPHAPISNLYGPTEAAVDVTAWECGDDVSRDPVPIGKPIANTRMYVLDAQRKPVPAGVLGELYIGGVQVALGYVNRPELTAERFVADPFSDAPHARLYRTGDLARWQNDGNIAYAGRIDHQVKVRGQRIELGEIETVLEQHASVRQCVVMARRIGDSDMQLVAYVLPNADVDSTSLVATLRAHMIEKLPAAMLANHIVVVAAWPLTASGKVDRKALPEPARKAPAKNQQPARNQLETFLVTSLCMLLGVASVGVEENFFELGATSLMCAHLIGKLRQQLSLDVPLVRIFEHPTIATLAAHLSSISEPRRSSAPPPPPSAAAGALDKAAERAARQRAAMGRPPPRRG